MEQAVLAGDPDAYLKHVAQDDAVFWKEQQNWAKDLRLHKPVEFTLAIVEPEPADAPPEAQADADAPKPDDPPLAPTLANTFAQDRAAFRLAMTWTMGDDVGGAGLKPRTVAYPVSFIRSGDAWLYQGETWSTELGSPAPQTPDAPAYAGVRVRYASGLGGAAKAVVEAMPLVRRKVDALFDQPIHRAQEVKLYASMLHLQASIYLSYIDSLGGWNEPGEAVKILTRSKTSADRLHTLLGHEYGHVATFELGPKASDMPWWVLEGVAEFSAGAVKDAEGKSADRAVLAWHKHAKLAPWDKLADFRGIDPALTRHVYAQGEHFVRWFSARYGQAARNRWLRLMAEGQTLDEATRASAGLPFAEADALWRADVAKSAEAAAQGDDDAK